ncbi:hypothetical protein Ga0123462_1728 [Mariprofundus ferrinatatus]|uniref:FtsK domain-containing protein n=1 Tax=Mariprofundus ferrinatatus TaxID=1921087 RepID=A0A2K8LE69_9PROT|nr:hypothetical protein [Mariprofundus ferrinatatus]ATX82576.1 hypothetical protein Ga0123462_1728 [Mariprofundus ferrinatatus]
MNVKPITKKELSECVELFNNLNLYGEDETNWIYPNLFRDADAVLYVVAPHCIDPDRFEKALYGLSTIFNRTITGVKDLGSHRWELLEDKLPELVPYSERPDNIPFGSFWLGTYADGSPIILDFEHSPVLMVAGASGSGKSMLFRVLLKEIERTWGAEAITIVEGTKDGNDFRRQPCKNLATDLEAALEVYREMARVFDERKEVIRELDVDNWLEARDMGYEWFPQYVLMDESPLFLTEPRKGDQFFDEKSEIIQIATHLAMRGRYVGLFQIFGTQDPSSSSGLPSGIMNQVRLKVGYGMRTAEMARAYFGQSTAIASDLVSGKGIAMLGAAPTLFRGALLKV